MGYATCIGRVGALAVALGVGTAIATTPGIGYASPGPSDSSGTDPSTPSAEPSSTGQTPEDGTPTDPADDESPPEDSSLPADEDGDTPPVGDGDVDAPEAIVDDDGAELPLADDAEVPDGDEDPVPGNGSDSTENPASDGLDLADLDNDATGPEVDDLSDLTDSGIADESPTLDDGSSDAPQLFFATNSAARSAAAVAPTARQLVSADAPTPVIDAFSDLVAAFGLMPGGTTPSAPALFTLMAAARREIGVFAQTQSPVWPGPVNLPVVAQYIHWPSWLGDAGTFLNTYVSFEPWLNGTIWLPPGLRPYIFHDLPVATTMQVALGTDPIPFADYNPDYKYSVPGQGLPGAPTHGTVVVNDNGTFTYTPDGDFETDTFSYVVDDQTSPHFHAWRDLLNGPFGLFNTNLDGGHRDTATVTVYNTDHVAVGSDITGDFSVLTYDISDMPFPLSNGPFPRFTNTLEIGKRINDFDIVNVQQDIAYHPFLVANALFPDETAPQISTGFWPWGVPFSDGLNSFSIYDINSQNRQRWDNSDSFLDPRGFTYERMAIPGGSTIDVYNVNTSGGQLNEDNITQLSAFVQANSLGRAVIVTGDFAVADSNAMDAFVLDNNLSNAGDPALTTKVFYRDSAPLPDASVPVDLTFESYQNETEKFYGLAAPGSTPVSVNFSYTVDAIGPETVDLENWMKDLPGINGLKLFDLPIPGTHDSGSYGINSNSEWAVTGTSNFPPILINLPPLIQKFIVKPIAANWGRTQEGNLYTQFEDGIRYVDLRLSYEPDGQIYFEHGLRGDTANAGLADIAQFANEHPDEVLIVYMQGFSNTFTDERHEEFIHNQVDVLLGDYMIPRSVGTDVTLDDIRTRLPNPGATNPPNVIVVYNNDTAVDNNANLWRNDTLWRPWHNPQSLEQLYDQNLYGLATLDTFPLHNQIWGMFTENTPNTQNIVMGILTLGAGSNRNLMWNVHPATQQWIRTQQLLPNSNWDPPPPPFPSDFKGFKTEINLVTADWYELWWPAGASFQRDVIGAVYETTASRH